MYSRGVIFDFRKVYLRDIIYNITHLLRCNKRVLFRTGKQLILNNFIQIMFILYTILKKTVLCVLQGNKGMTLL